MGKKLNQEEVDRLFELLQEACDLAEWSIAFNSEEDTVHGMIIGTMEYINSVVDALDSSVEDFEGYEVSDDLEKKKLH